MTITTLLRSATLALAFTAVLGGMSAAFAADASVVAAQQNKQSPYDGADFVIQENNINS